MMIKELTIELKDQLLQLKSNYYQQEKPQNRRDSDFFNYVKKVTEPTFRLVEEWEEKTAEQVKSRTLRVHPQQVGSTRENVELLLLHSYYIDVKESRYMNLHNSVLYVLDLIIEDVT